MVRFSLESDALGEFEWTGSTDPKARRRRWEEDGLSGDDSAMLSVVLPDDTFTGFVSWRSTSLVETRGAPRRASSVLRLEIGIALLPEHRGKGYGTAAVHRAIAGIALPNDASMALHRSFGFTEIGIEHEVGCKFGRYWDVLLLQRPLPDRNGPALTPTT